MTRLLLMFPRKPKFSDSCGGKFPYPIIHSRREQPRSHVRRAGPAWSTWEASVAQFRRKRNARGARGFVGLPAGALRFHHRPAFVCSPLSLGKACGGGSSGTKRAAGGG